MTTKKKNEMVSVECICSNVHLGNGEVLTCEKNPKNDNWYKGTKAQVPRADAVIMEANGQVKIL